MSIAVYIRVSSHSQKPDSQKAEISRWLKAHGHNLSEVMWYEDYETGTSMNRKEFNLLSEAVFAGTVKTVVVWKLDRLARSMKEGINVLSSLCESGVRVVSVTQQIDLSGTVGQMVAGVLFGIAQIEHQHIKERQAAGIAVAREKGIYTGRKKGSTKAKPERARELKAQGLKNKEIAKALSINVRTVGNYLRQM
ncbi:MAG: recombinase family protein [Alphaproteobacteria bacterium]